MSDYSEPTMRLWRRSDLARTPAPETALLRLGLAARWALVLAGLAVGAACSGSGTATTGTGGAGGGVPALGGSPGAAGTNGRGGSGGSGGGATGMGGGAPGVGGAGPGPGGSAAGGGKSAEGGKTGGGGVGGGSAGGAAAGGAAGTGVPTASCSQCQSTEGCLSVRVLRAANDSMLPWKIWPNEADGKGTLIVSATEGTNTHRAVSPSPVDLTQASAAFLFDLGCVAATNYQVAAFLDDDGNASATATSSADYRDACSQPRVVTTPVQVGRTTLQDLSMSISCD